jgi:hypothetical protein
MAGDGCGSMADDPDLADGMEVTLKFGKVMVGASGSRGLFRAKSVALV